MYIKFKYQKNSKNIKDPYCAQILSIERKQMTAEILWSIQHNPTKYGFQTVDFYGVTNHHTAMPSWAGWKLSAFFYD